MSELNPTSDSVWEKLSYVQQNLKVPKDQENKFGKYNYRSCEDILEHAKPWLTKAHVALVISDDIIPVGNRIYVKSTATFACESGQIVASGFAREDEFSDVKGMAAAQVTGSTSSYARKYALNGLFAIDDTQDCDTQDNTKSYSPKRARSKSVTLPIPALPDNKLQEAIIYVNENPHKVEAVISRLEGNYSLYAIHKKELRETADRAADKAASKTDDIPQDDVFLSDDEVML